MAHHAFFYAGNAAQGIAAARTYAQQELSLTGDGNPDLALFEYGLFSVEDARRIGMFAAQGSLKGGKKAIILSVGRMFHEAQNALLKLFEEPEEGTTLVLVVPAEGMLLPTLRSRLLPLPENERPAKSLIPEVAATFLKADKGEREKLVTKLVARTKADKDEEKQAARIEAIELLSGITHAAYAARRDATGARAGELDLLLRDLDRFAPILHERSVPYKLIFEHLLIVMPEFPGIPPSASLSASRKPSSYR